MAPGDVDALAAAVVSLMKDADLRSEMGANGKRRAEEEWSATSVARSTVKVYERALAGAKAP